MQATAIGTVAVTIVLLGAFLYVRATIAHVGNDVLKQIEISTYLKQDVTKDQTHAIVIALAKDNRVANVQFVPKAQGLKELRQKMSGQIDTSILTENPLPDKFRVRVRDPEQVAAVAKSIQKMPGVANVDYGQEIVQKLLQIAAVGRIIGMVVIAVFLVVAGIIISNTIRLTVFARRREISIMQLVGATNMYIRAPFICEGMVGGVLGAFLAVAILALSRAWLLPKLYVKVPFAHLSGVPMNATTLTLELLAVGAAVGIIASWISVGRYLRT
ncbi:MAG: ABC transporter permease [Candidatus Eremiobacteraeota bacterium]|nr:ABC transporter permease [Candidatus Eremiobacteraeota bacterium]